MSEERGRLLEQITHFYLESGDFNGHPAHGLHAETKAVLTGLIQEGLVFINFGDGHPNPHIQAFPPEPVDVQLEKLEQLGLEGACLYPTEKQLATQVDSNLYRDAPFTSKLYLGEPQLKYYSFELSILEQYRNDPRYHYDTDDVSGSISISSQHSESGTMAEADQILLQSFGFAYDDAMNRGVAVFLRYLHGLSPEHQRMWHARILTGTYKLHPDYYRSGILGEFYEGMSIFAAFVEEIRQINEMASLMGRAPLFKNEYHEEKRPREFGFLIRPTKKEFDNFVHLLDKMISENINAKFFRGEVDATKEVKKANGRVEVRSKGSLQMLGEWIDKTVRFPDSGPKDEMLKTFRKVRRLRQKPAHAVEDNVFDQEYLRQQRKVVQEAYKAMRTLRLILANHPGTRTHQVPEWLQTGRIWTY